MHSHSPLSSPVDRMAAIMAEVAREQGCCTDADLIDAGFTQSQIRSHAATARAAAKRLMKAVAHG